ncbi:MAG: serine/threonine protein kinase [Gammaproteobacteria bacterium]|nr:serine/threonine protein kinase [Gammaproteobacteria bacterium]
MGPYQIEGMIGAGGMGTIHKAKDTRLDRYVALKCLPPHLTVNNHNRERFLNEARAVSRLDHPNICTLYDVGETDDKQLYIALPFYEGYTLDKRIENGPMPWDEVVSISIQICEGLHAAHKHDIVHRDIKPANIIITSDNIVKILDFGVAKINGVNLTSTGVSLGTVAYMSPEQLEGKAVDARTDIWAMGVLLYEMLTGERPFKGDQAPAIIHAILYAELPDLSFSEPIPETLTQIMKNTLSRDIDCRYPSLAEFINDLHSVVGNKTIKPYTNESSSNTKSASTSQTTKVQFDVKTIDDLVKELSQHVGPMATVIVNKASGISNNYTELCKNLEKYLPDDETRQKMRHRFDVMTSAETEHVIAQDNTVSFSEEQLNCLITTSTSYIGPIAKMLVQRHSKHASSNDELCQRLADHIDNDADKIHFIDNAQKCF